MPTQTSFLPGLEIRIPTQVDFTGYQWCCPLWRHFAELWSCNRVFISTVTVSKHWWASIEMSADKSKRDENRLCLHLQPLWEFFQQIQEKQAEFFAMAGIIQCLVCPRTEKQISCPITVKNLCKSHNSCNSLQLTQLKQGTNLMQLM